MKVKCKSKHDISPKVSYLNQMKHFGSHMPPIDLIPWWGFIPTPFLMQKGNWETK